MRRGPGVRPTSWSRVGESSVERVGADEGPAQVRRTEVRVTGTQDLEPPPGGHGELVVRVEGVAAGGLGQLGGVQEDVAGDEGDRPPLSTSRLWWHGVWPGIGRSLTDAGSGASSTSP